MEEFLYVISNPSMPGLIKIGTTTNTPNERMSELHSTGVPTPFQLELSIKVKSGLEAEKVAHNSLSSYRVAKNREFFKVSVDKATRTILLNIDHYEIHEFKDGLKAPEIEEESNRRKLKREKENYDRIAKEVSEKLSKKKSLQKRKYELESEVNKLKNDRKNLGIKPVRETLSGFEEILEILYFPLPFGWITWVALFNPPFTLFAIPVLILGYFAYKKDNENSAKIALELAPFNDLDRKIRDLDGEIETVTTEIENLIIPVLPPNPHTKSSQQNTNNRDIKSQESTDTPIPEEGAKKRRPTPSRSFKWDDNCKGCNQHFTATLSHSEEYAICPNCFYSNKPPFKYGDKKPQQNYKKPEQQPSKPATVRNIRIDKVEVNCSFCGLVSEHEDSHLFSCPGCHRTIWNR